MRRVMKHSWLTQTRPGATRGSALTEFVIVIPLFLLLIFWSEFFADHGVMVLKADEAARYALWELTAPQKAGNGPEQAALNQDLQTRFASLNSPQMYEGSAPPTNSFKTVNVSVQSITWANAKVGGALPPFQPPFPTQGGLVGVIDRGLNGLASVIYNFFGSTAQYVIQQFGFSTTRDAQVTVQFSAPNSLFPGGSLFGIFFNATSNMQYPVANVTIQRASPMMLVDTWKAWPGPYGQVSSSSGTPLSKSYSATTANAVETEISARLQKAFSFASSVTNIINAVIGFFGLPEPFATTTWQSNPAGPVVALAGAVPNAAESPANGTPLQRLGNSPCVYNDLQTHGQPISPSSPAINGSVNLKLFQPCSSGNTVAGVDRARLTTPSQINSLFWNGIGGLNGNSSTNGISTVAASTTPANVNTPNVNPYPTLYSCRNVYYMGSRQAQNQKWDNSTGYYQQGFASCGSVGAF